MVARIALCAALCVSASAVWAAGAGADADFCPPGSGAGQCATPALAELNSLRGVAVDDETGRVYLADRLNNRVNVFNKDGSFVFAFGWGVDTGAPALQTCTAASTCQAGLPGAGVGQLDRVGRIAVDNDPTSPSRHDVYVAEGVNHRVQKFGPEGAFRWSVGAEGESEGQFKSSIIPSVGPGGTLYVVDNLPGATLEFEHRLQRFKPDGTLIAPQCVFFEGGAVSGLAVETGGSFWEANGGSERGIRGYDSACAPLTPGNESIDPEIAETNFLAIDAAGNLFAEQGEVRDAAIGAYEVLTAYDQSGAILRRFGYDRIPSNPQPEGLAVLDGAGGGPFVSLGSAGVRRLDYPSPPLPPPGPIVVPSSVALVKVGGAKAIAVAEANPEGKQTQVHVDYVTQAGYVAQGNSFTGPATKSTDLEPLGAEGFRLKSKELLIGCPDPGSESNLPGNDCLKPETAYRFRVVATNADGGGEGTVEGPPFTTPPSPEFGPSWAGDVGTDTARLSAELNPQGHATIGYFEYVDDARFQASGFDEASSAPDVPGGQAALQFGAGEDFVTRSAALYPLESGTTYHYRLISFKPDGKQVAGAAQTVRTFSPAASEPCPQNEPFRIGAGVLLPDCRAYELVSPLEKGGSDIRVLITNLQDPAVLEQSSTSGERLAFGSVRAFGDAPSAPLTSQYIAQRVAGSEWQTHAIGSPRGRSVTGGLIAEVDTEFKFFSPELCEGWQITYAEAPLAAGGVAGFSNLYRRSDRLCGPESYEALAPLVKPLPPGGGEFELELQGVSADGSHAIFISNGQLVKGKSTSQSQLYESTRGEALQVVCPAPCTAGSNSQLKGTRGASVAGAVSADGQRIFWSDHVTGPGKISVRIGGTQTVAVSEAAEKQAVTSGSWFWGASADGARAIFTTGGRLYEFTLQGKSTQLLAEGVLGVMGMSTDAGRIYFASTKALAAGAKEGEPNLYLREATEGGAQVAFVATLAAGDLPTTGFDSPLAGEPSHRNARVSADGLHAAFTSLASPTGYDNKDVATGEAAKEVYLYDAATRKLLCASCNPSGARPASKAFEGTRFASRILGFETQMHASRALSGDGNRLYFESADRLAPADSNGQIDVYQWEAAGVGGCTTSQPSYSTQDGGCVELISSGKSAVDSRFVEAGPDGHDVFFATQASLLPQDYGLVDIYDARLDGGLPVPPPEAPPCEGDSCHNAPPAPQAPSPASSGYHAPKQPGKGRKSCPKGKRAVRHKGKVRCVRRHRAHKASHRAQGRGGRR